MPAAHRKVFVDQATCLTASDVAKDFEKEIAKKRGNRENPHPASTANIANPDVHFNSLSIILSIAGNQYQSRLRWKAVSTATHYTLDCPITGRRVRKLYALGNKLGSREALGLLYASRDGSRASQRKARVLRLSTALNGNGIRKAARGQNRERILSKMSKLNQNHLDERDQRAVAKWVKLKSGDARSMQDALAIGFSYHHMFKPEERLGPIAGGPSDVDPYATAGLQRRGRFPMISLSALCATPQEHKGPGWVLEYADDLTMYAVCNDDPHGINLRLGRGGTPSSCQTFPLSRANGTLRTPCPVTGRPTDELYFRHDRWASAKAQRLS